MRLRTGLHLASTVVMLAFAATAAAQDTSFGQRLYQDKADCKFCHGPEGDGRGAIELKVRYSMFHADTKFFENDTLYSGWEALDPADFTNAGYTWTYGVNWYPDKMSRDRKSTRLNSSHT